MKLRHLILTLLTLALPACATAGGIPSTNPKPWLDASKEGACIAAQVLVGRCDAGAEKSADTCSYARVIARVCEAANQHGLVASAANPGSGYNPRSLTTFYRAFPGGPELRGTGNLSADPWALACSGRTGSALAACLRSRFLTSTPAVCAEYARAFGVDSCGTPAGGWTRGPSNERWGSALQALNFFCENDPAVIGSTGRAGGLDCESTAVEWARLGAFGGEAIVTEWQRRTEPPVCGNHRRDPGETCSNCVADVGACPPPPPPPPVSDGKADCSLVKLPAPGAPQYIAYNPGTASTGSVPFVVVECRGGALPPVPPPRPNLSEKSRGVLAKVCTWLRGDRRSQCAAAIAELFGLEALDAQIREDAEGAR